MEFCLSGNALKTFNRSIICLARVGNELVIHASPSQIVFHTLNSSRSAYQAITFKADLFDIYKISATQAQCSVLLKAVCSILRTPPTSMDRLCVLLLDSEAAKIQWTIDCFNGIRKAYSITCNIQPDIQHLSLDRTKFPSSFVVRPRDFTRLLANFQASLQEITIIATEPTPIPSDAGNAIGGKAVELRSYIDPTKDNIDSALHTQLWIDPAEEFLQYSHTGDAVDVTFSVKELKAFVSFCEGCEVDVHLFFEKAGEPILLAPKFGFDDGSNSDFDVTLVLATMLISQLQDRDTPQQASAHGMGSQAHHGAHTSTQERQRQAIPTPVSEPSSDHTRIWSELSGSAAKVASGVEERQVQMDRCADASGENGLQRHDRMDPSKPLPERVNKPFPSPQPMETDDLHEFQDRTEQNINGWSQRHPSNWISTGDDDEEDEAEFYVQPTP